MTKKRKKNKNDKEKKYEKEEETRKEREKKKTQRKNLLLSKNTSPPLTPIKPPSTIAITDMIDWLCIKTIR